MSSERGSALIWIVGLTALLLLFGGLAVDFWRALALQRELAAVADSAALAAASGIDEEHYRDTGEVVLDSTRATALGLASIEDQDVELMTGDVETSPDGLQVNVVLIDVLELGLLGILVDQTEPLTVRAEATAVPRRLP